MSFTIDMKKFIAKANKNVNDVIGVTIIGMTEQVIRMSPVGNPSLWTKEFVKAATELGWIGAGYVGGRFRANWDYGIGSAPRSQYDAIDKTGSTSMDRVKSKITTDMAGKVHYIVNNLPYAQRLEDGYSTQAPAGMVGLTVIKFQSIVDAAARSLK